MGADDSPLAGRGAQSARAWSLTESSGGSGLASLGPLAGPLLEAAGVRGLLAGLDGRILAVTHSLASLLGLSAAELLAGSVTTLLEALAGVAKEPRLPSLLGRDLMERGSSCGWSADEPFRPAGRTLSLRLPSERLVVLDRRLVVVDGEEVAQLWTVTDVADPSTVLDANGTAPAAAGETLARLSRELEAARLQLLHAEKMASLGTLVASVAHEINTPLGAVSSMHDTLVRAVEKLRVTLVGEGQQTCIDDPKLASLLRFIDDANRVIADGAGRVNCIVKRLRTFARSDDDDLVTTDLHQDLEATLQLVRHQVKSRIRVVREFGELPPVACFPGRMNQLFLNLMVNAIQAIDGGGEIHVRTHATETQAVIQITDTGKGIPAEQLPRIFELGFTTKGASVGTGLGLAICRQIVDAHRGRISVESQLGVGTCVTVAIPLDLERSLANVHEPMATHRHHV